MTTEPKDYKPFKSMFDGVEIDVKIVGVIRVDFDIDLEAFEKLPAGAKTELMKKAKMS